MQDVVTRTVRLIGTGQYQTFRCDLPCVSWLVASWATGDWVRGGSWVLVRRASGLELEMIGFGISADRKYCSLSRLL